VNIKAGGTLTYTLTTNGNVTTKGRLRTRRPTPHHDDADQHQRQHDRQRAHQAAPSSRSEKVARAQAPHPHQLTYTSDHDQRCLRPYCLRQRGQQISLPSNTVYAAGRPPLGPHHDRVLVERDGLVRDRSRGGWLRIHSCSGRPRSRPASRVLSLKANTQVPDRARHGVGQHGFGLQLLQHD
jgi:hypothetical protein